MSQQPAAKTVDIILLESIAKNLGAVDEHGTIINPQLYDALRRFFYEREMYLLPIRGKVLDLRSIEYQNPEQVVRDSAAALGFTIANEQDKQNLFSNIQRALLERIGVEIGEFVGDYLLSSNNFQYYKLRNIYIFQNSNGDIYTGAFYCSSSVFSFTNLHLSALYLTFVEFGGCKFTREQKEKIELTGTTQTVGGCVADLDEKIKNQVGTPSKEKPPSERALACFIDFVLHDAGKTLGSAHHSLKVLTLPVWRKHFGNTNILSFDIYDVSTEFFPEQKEGKVTIGFSGYALYPSPTSSDWKVFVTIDIKLLEKNIYLKATPFLEVSSHQVFLLQRVSDAKSPTGRSERIEGKTEEASIPIDDTAMENTFEAFLNTLVRIVDSVLEDLSGHAPLKPLGFLYHIRNELNWGMEKLAQKNMEKGAIYSTYYEEYFRLIHYSEKPQQSAVSAAIECNFGWRPTFSAKIWDENWGEQKTKLIVSWEVECTEARIQLSGVFLCITPRNGKIEVHSEELGNKAVDVPTSGYDYIFIPANIGNVSEVIDWFWENFYNILHQQALSILESGRSWLEGLKEEFSAAKPPNRDGQQR